MQREGAERLVPWQAGVAGLGLSSSAGGLGLSYPAWATRQAALRVDDPAGLLGAEGGLSALQDFLSSAGLHWAPDAPAPHGHWAPELLHPDRGPASGAGQALPGIAEQDGQDAADAALYHAALVCSATEQDMFSVVFADIGFERDPKLDHALDASAVQDALELEGDESFTAQLGPRYTSSRAGKLQMSALPDESLDRSTKVQMVTPPDESKPASPWWRLGLDGGENDPALDSAERARADRVKADRRAAEKAKARSSLARKKDAVIRERAEQARKEQRKKDLQRMRKAKRKEIEAAEGNGGLFGIRKLLGNGKEEAKDGGRPEIRKGIRKDRKRDRVRAWLNNLAAEPEAEKPKPSLFSPKPPAPKPPPPAPKPKPKPKQKDPEPLWEFPSFLPDLIGKEPTDPASQRAFQERGPVGQFLEVDLPLLLVRAGVLPEPEVQTNAFRENLIKLGLIKDEKQPDPFQNFLDDLEVRWRALDFLKTEVDGSLREVEDSAMFDRATLPNLQELFRLVANGLQEEAPSPEPRFQLPFDISASKSAQYEKSKTPAPKAQKPALAKKAPARVGGPPGTKAQPAKAPAKAAEEKATSTGSGPGPVLTEAINAVRGTRGPLGQIDSLSFMRSCRAVVPMTEYLGGVSGLVKGLIVEKIDRIEGNEAFNKNPDLRAIVLEEKRLGTDTENLSFTNGVIWLCRTMRFVIVLLEEVSPDDGQINKAAQAAYKVGLGPYFNFAQRTAFSTATRALPKRKAILDRFSADEPAVKKSIAQLAQGFLPLLDDQQAWLRDQGYNA